MANITLTSKFVDVQSTGGPGFALYGYRNTGGTYGLFGTLSETANGSSNDTTSNWYSSSTQILEVYWADQTTDTLYLTVAGNRSNSLWTSILIGTNSFTRSSATYSYNSGTNRTTWSWVTSTNPFGTTGGVDVAVDIRLDVNTGHQATIDTSNLTATETTTRVYTLSNGNSTTKYRIIKETGTTPSVADGGTVNSRTGNGAIDIPTAGLPTAGNTATYQVQIGGPNSQTSDNDAWIDTTGQTNSFSITRDVGITAPVISSVTNNNASAANVTATVNLSSNGSGGTLQYAQTTANSVPATGWQSSASFTHPRGTTRYYWASQATNTAGAFDDSGAIAVGYLLPDLSLTATSPTITSGASSATTNVQSGNSTDTYAVRLNNGGTNIATRTGIGNITFSSSLPTEGNTTTYEIFARRPTSTGGDGLTFYASNDTFTVTRTDGTPNAYTIPDVTNAALNTEQNVFVQIAGITETATASRTSGTATFAVSSSTTTPAAGSFSSTAKNITNNQYLHVKQDSSGTFGTTLNTVFSIGGVTDTFSNTTAAGIDYFVTINAEIEVELGDTFITGSLTGSGVRLSSTSPLQLNPGDRVGFNKNATLLGGGPAPSNTATASGFASTHWTNTNNLTLTTSFQYKTIKTGVSITVADLVTVGITSGNGSFSDNTYYIGTSVQPDLSIDVGNRNIEIATTATSFTQSISNSSGTSSTNSSITEYRIKDSSTSHESRVGYGNITVTDVPPNPGFPKSYSVEARVTTANGGSGLYKDCPNSIFSVLATTSASTNDPTLGNYGVALYDDQGALVTSFTEGHTVLRKIFATASAVALSTSTHTDVDTGLTGITTSNCVIAIDGDTTTAQGTGGSVRLPATFVTGGNGNINVRVGRVTSAKSVNIEVLQHKGATIGATAVNYGMIINNGDDQTVLDESSEVFSVREIIDINPALSTQVLYQNDETFFIYLELTQGRYPGADGPPIPALRCSSSVTLLPPTLTGVKHPDGSYKTVLIQFVKPTSLSNYKLAMLVPGTGTPEYYGGSASDYGLEFRDNSGDVIWRSDYRQAIANNIIAANQFSAGTSQNGNYDVTTGADGVSAPVATTSSEFELPLYSTDTSVTVSNLSQMDPSNSYVAGALTAMFVEYYAGRYLDPEFGIDDRRGGGQHILGLRILNTTSAALTTYRFRGGSAFGTAYGERNPNSYHPEGNFVIFRIV